MKMSWVSLIYFIIICFTTPSFGQTKSTPKKEPTPLQTLINVVTWEGSITKYGWYLAIDRDDPKYKPKSNTGAMVDFSAWLKNKPEHDDSIPGTIKEHKLALKYEGHIKILRVPRIRLHFVKRLRKYQGLGFIC